MKYHIFKPNENKIDLDLIGSLDYRSALWRNAKSSVLKYTEKNKRRGTSLIDFSFPRGENERVLMDLVEGSSRCTIWGGIGASHTKVDRYVDPETTKL